MFKTFKSQQGIGLLSYVRLQVRLNIAKLCKGEINNYIEVSLQNTKYLYNTILKRKNIYIICLKQIKHIKGKKIHLNKPLNGQRTHTNAKTVKKLFIINKI